MTNLDAIEADVIKRAQGRVSVWLFTETVLEVIRDAKAARAELNRLYEALESAGIKVDRPPAPQKGLCVCGHPDSKHTRQRYRPVKANWSCSVSRCDCLAFEETI